MSVHMREDNARYVCVHVCEDYERCVCTCVRTMRDICTHAGGL